MRARSSANKRTGQPFSRWKMGEFVQDRLHLKQKLTGHLRREAVADEDALDHEIFAVGRHRVGRNKPASLAQSIGEIVEGEV